MRPWRQIAIPHQDVLEGTFKQAEFAADLSQVAEGTALPAYQNPESFFARTYITEGMERLLVSVVQRLAGKGGDPVIQLQTNFGGGKTHTLLAVYHLACHTCPTDLLRGIPALLDKAGVTTLPQSRIAVIDGNNLSPNQPAERGALRLHTVWGQIAYQLLGQEGYEMVADSDVSGTAPGKEVMIALLKKAAPCIVLMDELVAFYRQLVESKVPLTAGTLESNMSFIQSLTESVKAVPNAILLASLPESDTEAVGTFGPTVLTSLEKYFGRVESVWKPVASDESFEIVRRRLFDTVGDPEEMEAVCREFVNFYRKNKDKFPPEVQESVYAERLRQSYPIHPEIFDRLYQDWSTLDKFQKTRGVLQYMAIIIHRLWEINDQDALIMPGSIPLEDAGVRTKSTHYLPQGWDPIIEAEIDGPRSEPAILDGSDTRFGGIQAAHRAARTIFLGSAPSSPAQRRRGISIERILLGCAVPGQTLAIYEDVLKRLRDKLHYLFADSDHFWFDTRPNLRREMESRKDKIDSLSLQKALMDKTKKKVGHGQFFAGVHVFTPHADIPDEIGSGPRLVVLPLETSSAYSAANQKQCFEAAEAILRNHGSQPRLRCNRLFFLAPEFNSLNRVQVQCRVYLAWKEIVSDIESARLNLDQLQARQARQEQDAAETALEQSIVECFRVLLIPEDAGHGKIGFQTRSFGRTGGSIASAVETTLIEGQEVIQKWSPVFLKRLLEQYYFKDGKTEVPVLTLWQDLCSYLYMDRLLNKGVLEETIADGVSKGDFFGFADCKEGDKYLGFKYGEQVFTINIDEAALLVECGAAAEYKAAAAKLPIGGGAGTGSGTGNGAGVVEKGTGAGDTGAGAGGDTPPKKVFRLYSGSKLLDSFSGASEAQQIYEELVALFTTKPGVDVKIHLDIEVTSEKPFDDNTVRAVRENSANLGFDPSSDFQ